MALCSLSFIGFVYGCSTLTNACLRQFLHYTLQSGKFGKLNKAVRFPENLNLIPYVSGTDDKSPLYTLYAVLVHLDVMKNTFSGHYVCYVRSTQGKWFMADDSTVCYLLTFFRSVTPMFLIQDDIALFSRQNRYVNLWFSVKGTTINPWSFILHIIVYCGLPYVN